MERINNLSQLKYIVWDWAKKHNIRIEGILWENTRVATILLSSHSIVWLDALNELSKKVDFVGVDTQDKHTRIILLISKR